VIRACVLRQVAVSAQHPGAAYRRFLEHSRLFWLAKLANGDFFCSADWMPRTSTGASRRAPVG